MCVDEEVIEDGALRQTHLLMQVQSHDKSCGNPQVHSSFSFTFAPWTHFRSWRCFLFMILLLYSSPSAGQLTGRIKKRMVGLVFLWGHTLMCITCKNHIATPGKRFTFTLCVCVCRENRQRPVVCLYARNRLQRPFSVCSFNISISSALVW